MSTGVPASSAPRTAKRGEGPVMTAAKAPVTPGRITLVGVVLAVLLCALGIVAVRDALISAGVVDGGSVIESSVDYLDGLEPQWWLVPAGIVAALLGLWLLAVALRPRPRRGVALTSATGVFLRPRDVRRLAERAAEDVDGVLSTRVTSSRRRTGLRVVVTGEDPRIAQEVQSAVGERLAALQSPPRLAITLTPADAP